MLDKGRATLSQKNGEYNYNSPTDQHLVRFLGFDADVMLKELAAGKGEGIFSQPTDLISSLVYHAMHLCDTVVERPGPTEGAIHELYIGNRGQSRTREGKHMGEWRG